MYTHILGYICDVNMCVLIYVYTYIRNTTITTHIYLRIHTYMYTHIHVHTYLHGIYILHTYVYIAYISLIRHTQTCLYSCTHTFTYICTQAHCTHILAQAHTYIHTCVHTYTHTDTYFYTYLHTYMHTHRSMAEERPKKTSKTDVSLQSLVLQYNFRTHISMYIFSCTYVHTHAQT